VAGRGWYDACPSRAFAEKYVSRYIAAIDQGTTSTRCILFERNGVAASAQKEHRQIYPRPGWVEHDPMEIWQRTQQVVAEALSAAGAAPGEIAAIGITNQRETTIAWDRTTGQLYSNAIVWQDTRTQAICDQLAADAGADRFRDRVGLPLATYFSAPKIRWMLENVPGLRAEAEAGKAVFGTVDTWLIWQLTGGVDGGVLVTDVTNASRTMLMDLRTLEWDEQMLRAFGVPRQSLPAIRSSADPRGLGTTRRGGPFGGEIAITADLGDQQAALVGQACFEPGECKNTYGTGCFMLLNTGPAIVRSGAGLLTTVAYRLGDAPAHYALEGSIAITGALVQWLRDNLGIIGSSAEIESLAGSVPDNGGAYFVPAFSGLFAPHWRSDARGTIVGLTAHTTKAHIARAALEAAAYQTRDVLLAMKADTGRTITSLKVDGGMTVNDLLMQFQADILGIPVVASEIAETTALGAAYAAGLAVGYWRDVGELRRARRARKTWTPRMDEQTRRRLCADWLRAIDRSLGWADGTR
jgi:glycerol kinase